MKKLKTYHTELTSSKGSLENVILVDTETGEELDPVIKKHTFMVGKDEFYLVYTHLINALSQELNLSEIKVYSHLLSIAKGPQSIAINKGIKQEICDTTGLKNIRTVDNALKSLQETEIPFLFKTGRALFKLNPRFAYKGYDGSKGRDKNLKAIIELGCTNC